MRSNFPSRATDLHLRQSLAEFPGERPAPLGDAFVRRDAATAPPTGWRHWAAATLAAAALLSVWALNRRTAQPAPRAVMAAQQQAGEPPLPDLAALVALAPTLRGLSLIAVRDAAGHMLLPGPERIVAIAEPTPVGELRTALAAATSIQVEADARPLQVTLYFPDRRLEAFLVLTDAGTARLRLPKFGVQFTPGPVAKAALFAAARSSAAAAVPARRRIQVDNARALALAIGSDRTIEITCAAPLQLDEVLAADGKVPEGSGLLFEANEFGELGPTLRAVHNLHIRALHGTATLSIASPMTDVLRLIDCEDVTLENLVLGHSSARQTCSAPVITSHGGARLRLFGGELYGCGALGIDAQGTSSISLLGTRIDRCSNGILMFQQCQDARFALCDFADTEAYYDGAFVLKQSPSVFTGCTATGIRSMINKDLFDVQQGNVRWLGGAIHDNRVQQLGPKGAFSLEGTVAEHNGEPSAEAADGKGG